MLNAKFIYMNNLYDMKFEKKDTILNVLTKYASILNNNLNELCFIYKGKILSLKNNEKIDKFKNTRIFVFNINIKNNNNELKYLICPECNNLSTIKNNEDLFSFNCINNHNVDNITINSLIDTQKVDDSKIKCNICGNNKNYYSTFYKCSNGDNICSICSENSKYNLINYEYRFSICAKHNMKFISYCIHCNINLCRKCEEEHKVHKNNIKIFKEIKPNYKRIEEIKKEESKINMLKNELKNLGKYINDIIKIIINNLDKYIILYKYIINSIKNMDNYESINNALNIDTKKLIKNLNYILNEDNINKKINQILNIYNNMKNEITIIYKNKYRNFRLFGEDFIKNNKEKCYLLINHRKFDLLEYFPLVSNEDKIKIKLIEKKKITNMSYMFDDCGSLLSLPDISNWNITNVTNMRYMFFMCSSLLSLPDTLNWNVINVIDMEHMFYGCSSLLSLPDISNWNTKNVTDMHSMFDGCSSLLSLPDISNWNTDNVKHKFFGLLIGPNLKHFSEIIKKV